MAQEELAFSCHCLPYVFFAVNIFLASINNSNVTWTFSQQRETSHYKYSTNISKASTA